MRSEPEEGVFTLRHEGAIGISQVKRMSMPADLALKQSQRVARWCALHSQHSWTKSWLTTDFLYNFEQVA